MITFSGSSDRVITAYNDAKKLHRDNSGIVYCNDGEVMLGRLIKVMGYRDDECRLVKSSVGQFNVSKDTTTYSKIDESQGVMIIVMMHEPS